MSELVNPDTLRLIDRLIGLPLCAIATFARYLRRLFVQNQILPRQSKVLVIKLSEMGSSTLAYPALAELKRRCPKMELFFLVFSNNVDIIHALALTPAHKVITVDPRSITSLLTSGFRAMQRLLKEQIDTTIDMDFFSRLTALIAFVVCRGNRVGFHRYTNEGLNRGNLLSHRVLYSPHVHTSVAFMALVRALFEDPQDEPHYRGRIDPNDFILPKYEPPPLDIERVWKKLQVVGVVKNGKPAIIVINPNSSIIFPLRKWPLDYFAELCAKLLKELPSCWLVITGVAAEHEDAQYIIERVQDSRCIDFTGATSFPELLALYSIASVMVTNDSGPAHFASLLDLPTVVLFGPETPRLYSRLGNRGKDLYSDFACSPCVSVYNGKKSSCQDNRCLKTIAVDQVLKNVLASFNEYGCRVAR